MPRGGATSLGAIGGNHLDLRLPPGLMTSEGVRVNDQLDVNIQDAEVLAEIEMMTNLIIATSEADGPLPQQRIDEILGLDDEEA